MAVHLGTPTTSAGAGDTITVPHSTPDDTERVLVVCIAVGLPSSFVSSVTYDGDPLTNDEGNFSVTSSSGSVEAEVWWLADPPIGAHDLVVTFEDASDYALAAFPARGVSAGSIVATMGHMRGVWG